MPKYGTVSQVLLQLVVAFPQIFLIALLALLIASRTWMSIFIFGRLGLSGRSMGIGFCFTASNSLFLSMSFSFVALFRPRLFW